MPTIVFVGLNFTRGFLRAPFQQSIKGLEKNQLDHEIKNGHKGVLPSGPDVKQYLGADFIVNFNAWEISIT